MSGVYTLEPSTRGRLTLHTTHGALTIALWADCAPRCARAFVGHALRGEYDGTAFHRVVPGVLVQGGDVGAAAGAPLEAHGRLKFRRRGLVALVGDGARRCGPQFFVTLAATPWLDGEHAIIGHVDGDTVFNALALAEAAANSDTPPRVKAVTVLDNPFPDIEPRAPAPKPKDDGVKKPTVAAVRNQRLLSFGDDDDDDDADNELNKTAQPKRAFPSAVPAPSKPATSAPANTQQLDATAKPNKKAAAEGEFARLLGLARKKKGKPKQSGEDKDKKSAGFADARVSKLPRPAPKAKAKDELALPTTSRRRRDSAREAEVLKKLARFEKRLTAARNAYQNDKDGDGAAASAWFGQPLRSSTTDETNAEADEDEYVAFEGIPDDAR